MGSRAKTIQDQFAEKGVSLGAGDDDYHPMLAIMEIMMGYKPKLNALAKVWSPGFQTFHLLFKNSANMPNSMLGTDPFIRELFLAIYASSKETGCEYCTATIVGVALRRGTLPSRIVCKAQTPQDAALFKMSKSLARMPVDFSVDDLEEMRNHFGEGNIEWIALAVGLGGFLNLITKASGLGLSKQVVDATAPVLSKVEDPGEKTDTESASESNSEESALDGMVPQREQMSTFLRMARYGPHAMYVETKWVAGVPSGWPSAGKFLKKRIGYSFPILGEISHYRARMAYATIIRDNFDPELSEIGLVTKSLCGLVYATCAGDTGLASEAKKLAVICAERDELFIDRLTFDEVVAISQQPVVDSREKAEEMINRLSSLSGISTRKAAAAIILARAASTRPTHISETIIDNVTSILSPSEVVETLMWIGLQQCFYRFNYFCKVRDALDEATRMKQEHSLTEQTAEELTGATISFRSERKGIFSRLRRRFFARKKSTQKAQQEPVQRPVGTMEQ